MIGKTNLLTRINFYVILGFISLILLGDNLQAIALNDAAEPWQLGFQDPATPIMEGIIEFHNNLMFFITLIAVFTSWVLGRCLYFYNSAVQKESELFTHSTPLEVVWTIVPALILLVIAVPSFSLLYSMDEMLDPSLTLKVIGHQWYWSYEYSDYTSFDEANALNFDSYMLPLEDITLGNLRLLEVDNRVVLPVNVHIRVIVSAADVLHSWAVPSCGIKVDACPGRMNHASMFIKREGVYFGQCSEICGINHGFMPIVLKVVSLNEYVAWISRKLETTLI